MTTPSLNSFDARRTLTVGSRELTYYSLRAPQLEALGVDRLPFAIRVLLENLLRHEDGLKVHAADIDALARWADTPTRHGEAAGDDAREIAFTPERVLMQDLTGVPAVVDLASMRDAIIALGGDPQRINPLVPVELVIDHSIILEHTGTPSSYDENVAIEYERNVERYTFLKWAQNSFEQFRVVPPGMGICHQVNLEHLARVVFDHDGVAYPDTVVGTDSHTTMINGLSVLGWGVGGIEAEAAMLGQPLYFLAPEVVGFKLTGSLSPGTTATDLALTVTEMLRRHGVVGKFVEFFGPGLEHMTLADRATVANMAPEYGATCGFFPADRETLAYMELTGRDAEQVALVEWYLREQGLFRDANKPDPEFSDVIELDLSTLEPSLAGPKRPQDRVPLGRMQETFRQALTAPVASRGFGLSPEHRDRSAQVVMEEGPAKPLADGSVVIAAITSCTNTSNPSVMLGAGLLAKNAVERGLTVSPTVKTSLAPGSRAVARYLETTGLHEYIDRLGFNVVGFGCTTCIGNSGPLPEPVARAIEEQDLTVASVLSGNRNFEGRIHPLAKANYLASPPLVVAYALAGTVDIDLTRDPIGTDREGHPVYLRDIWPDPLDIERLLHQAITPEVFRDEYRPVFSANERWNAIQPPDDPLYQWDADSTYIRRPPFFEGWTPGEESLESIAGARVLAVLGDSVTTDHISPAGSIAPDSPAARYLTEHGIERKDFNSYGARRGNHEVMMRGTFANIRIRNAMVPDVEGGYTRVEPGGPVLSIYDAAMAYQADGVKLVILAGKEYGTGSSRDWAAKGPMLQGVRAVLAESFERIHRSNLVGMGVLPLQFEPGVTAASLGLDGTETFDVNLPGELTPLATVKVTAHRSGGEVATFTATARLDTLVDVEYYRNGGILQAVLSRLSA